LSTRPGIPPHLLEVDIVAEPVTDVYVRRAIARHVPAPQPRGQWFKVALLLGAYLARGDEFMGGTVGDITVAAHPSECFVQVWYVDPH
jgi:hypothetical protein